MPISSKQPTTVPNAEYQQAQQFIDKSLSNMDNDTHYEYASTMKRDPQLSKWEKWIDRLLRLT